MWWCQFRTPGVSPMAAFGSLLRGDNRNKLVAFVVLKVKEAPNKRLLVANMVKEATTNRLSLANKVKGTATKRLFLANAVKEATTNRLSLANKVKETTTKRLLLANEIKDPTTKRLLVPNEAKEPTNDGLFAATKTVKTALEIRQETHLVLVNAIIAGIRWPCYWICSFSGLVDLQRSASPARTEMNWA